MTDALNALYYAWYDKGVRPDHHDRMKAKMLDEWPTLYIAISKVMNEFEEGKHEAS